MRTSQPRGLPPIVVALPAKDEAEEIDGCLQALASQVGAQANAVVVCLNNTTDDSAARIGRIAPQLPFAVHVLDVVLPPDQAFASVARRIAMDRAVTIAGPAGLLLTSDADGRVAPDWLMVNLTAIRNGAEAVAGRAEIDPVGAKSVPAYLHAIDARECAYAALLDEIAALLDPDPFDPWPRHDEHSGASIAVTVAVYRRAGGMPRVKLGEDRAFFDALRRVDARIRHDPAARVVVSARTVGRAAGGMADTMRRRMQQVDAFLDERLEPVTHAVRRARLRQRLRALWTDRVGEAAPAYISEADRTRRVVTAEISLAGGIGQVSRPMVSISPRATQGDVPGQRESVLARQLAIPVATLRHALAECYFGTAWAAIEAASPVFVTRPVALADLAVQTDRASRIRDRLQEGALLRPAIGQGGKPLRVAAA